MMIFLDIDGVLVPAKSWEKPRLLDDGFPEFSLAATRVLNLIISENTKVMLTTSHKSSFTIPQWKRIFSKRGLNIHKIGKLKENKSMLSRKDEITNWFLSNKIEDTFIIIDDDKSLNALPQNLKKHLILTSPMIGLDERHSDEINNLLRKD
jgi:hypothetical protein